MWGSLNRKAELSHQQTTISPPKVIQFTDSPIKKEKIIKVYASIHYYRHSIIVLACPAARRLDFQACPKRDEEGRLPAELFYNTQTPSFPLIAKRIK
jgi:hypothetical protein